MTTPKYMPPKKSFKLSARAKRSFLPRMILMNGGFQIRWDDDLNCFVDYMGMPLSHTDCAYLIERATQHLQHSPAELADIKRLALKEHGMERQIEVSAEDMK